MTLGFSAVMRIAALVLFVLAALFGFGVGSVDLPTVVGLVSVGLASWVGSTLVP